MRPTDQSAGDEAEEQVSEDDRLLLAAIEGPESGWEHQLERVCTQHPEREATLRRRFRMLKELGLLAASAEPTTRLGPYRLIRQIGGGGMGLVYLAEHETLRRPVALKLVRPELLDSPRARE